MAPEKRNKFLEADESEDDSDQGYDSEAEELRKGGRSAKRRKVEDEGEVDDLSDEEDDDDDEFHTPQKAAETTTSAADDDDENNDENNEEDDEGANADAEASNSSTKKPSKKSATPAVASAAPELPDVTRPLTKKNLVATEEAVRKSGVVYISRVPPFMKPAKLRSLLEPYGRINRIFLAPEDPAAHARRVRAGGNKKRSFTEGWVEFMRKRDAKAACELLNARTIGGKKGSYYHDDIWTLKYLKGFKWRHLTEQISAENAERTSRMRAEIGKAGRENREFVRNVERARVLDGIAATKAKREGRRQQGGVAGEAADGGAAAAAAAPAAMEAADAQREDRKRRSVFKQIPLAEKKSEAAAGKPTGDVAGDVARVLGKIF